MSDWQSITPSCSQTISSHMADDIAGHIHFTDSQTVREYDLMDAGALEALYTAESWAEEALFPSPE